MYRASDITGVQAGVRNNWCHSSRQFKEVRGTESQPTIKGRYCRDMCFPPDLGSPHTYPYRDICSPTQISLIIMQQWKVFPQGKMFPQMVRWLIDTCIHCACG